MKAQAWSRWSRAAAGLAAVVVLFAVLALWRPPYAWLKAAHVMAIIAWMAGILYLPRLFVYHCEAETGSRQSETFKVMERRLLRGITNPAMVASWGSACGSSMTAAGSRRTGCSSRCCS